jgi:UDP-N-acetyl-D-glucosamine dehydrogenase
VVKQWRNEVSSDLGGAEIIVVATLHDVIDKNTVAKIAPYVFDTTGKLNGVKAL